MEKIMINGLRIYAYHGVHPEEKEKGQVFVLDLTLEADLSRACQSDNLDDTVNYSAVVKTVSRAFCEKKYDLIERAAQVVADCILQAFPPVRTVRVLLKKPNAPVAADLDYVAVELYRKREETKS